MAILHGSWILAPPEQAGSTPTPHFFIWGETWRSGKPSPDDEMFQPSGEVEITGLLRTSEPDGTVLERNKPAQNRWVSRDVAAMS
ncbi:MAG: SURF1 family protein, partial [Cyanobacteria bacterium P01_F01_bin.42]